MKDALILGARCLAIVGSGVVGGALVLVARSVLRRISAVWLGGKHPDDCAWCPPKNDAIPVAIVDEVPWHERETEPSMQVVEEQLDPELVAVAGEFEVKREET